MTYNEAIATADIYGLKERARRHREKGMELLSDDRENERWKGLEQLGHATKTERYIMMLENEYDVMWRGIERQPKTQERVSEGEQSLTMRKRRYVLQSNQRGVREDTREKALTFR